MTRLKPGGTLVLVAQFELDPGARLGWQRSGSSSAPTVVEFTVPPGFTQGPTRYSAPQRIDTASGPRYGYSSTASVVTEVRIPWKLERGVEYAFEAHASWEACNTWCLVARDFAQLLISTRQPVNAAPAFDTTTVLRSIPKALSELSGVTHSRDDEGGLCRYRFALEGPGAEPAPTSQQGPTMTPEAIAAKPLLRDFLASAGPWPSDLEPGVTRGTDALWLTWPCTRAATTAGSRGRVEGVLEVTDGGRRSTYWVSLPADPPPSE